MVSSEVLRLFIILLVPILILFEAEICIEVPSRCTLTRSRLSLGLALTEVALVGAAARARLIISVGVSVTVSIVLHLAGAVLIEHVGQDVLCVLEAFDHLQVGRVHSTAKGISSALTPLIHVGDNLGLAREHDLSVVLEVDLDHFI